MSPTSTPQDVTNVVAGKVLHKETGDGVADLLVELFDIDDWVDPEVPKVAVVKAGAVGDGSDTNGAAAPGDVGKLYASPTARVCSGWTDSSGGFRLEFSPGDFNVRTAEEQRPDLVLVVLAPEEPGVDVEKRVLYLSGGVRWNAGSREAYIIRLSTALLQERGIPIQQGGDDRTQQRVSLYVAQRESERDFNSGAASYHGGYATQETSDRKQFRDTFVKTIATDFSTVPVSGVMVQEGDNIQEKNGTTIAGGVAKVNDAVGDSDGAGVPVNLYLTPADRDRLHQYFDNAQGEFVEIPESELQGILFRGGNTDNAGALIFQNSPISAFLSEQSADEACAKVHTGLADDEPGGSGESNGNGSGNGTNPLTDADIPRFLARMVSDMPSPDSVLSPAAKRADQGVIDKAVDAFALQKGPAENPAFWDFDTLQIAFDHVWKQLLDETIPNLAYTANTIAKGRFGIDSAVSDVFNNGLKLGDTFWQMTPVEVPPVVARFFDITKEEFNELSFAMRDQLVAIAGAISMRAGTTIADLRIVQTLTEQGDRLIDTVRHDDVYTLHKTLRELEAKLNGTYEFTVFAADKDYHSVNFGLVVTYREKLTPLMYQAGQLVKSIPLAPKEERKYSVKVTRNEKRSSKEARKNNSSLTTEQSETARVEAEIIKKAQTKTTFGVTAEGDYDIGISSGKGTTSFGVEAIGESAQTQGFPRPLQGRAGLHVGDQHRGGHGDRLSQEYNESGTISIPNEELSVNYLFYELQKRYRVSESVYRVMPSVLVAQEMPLPSQITEAWVISHDWILNRYLLDDSFRPDAPVPGQQQCRGRLRPSRAEEESAPAAQPRRHPAHRVLLASVEAENRYKALEGRSRTASTRSTPSERTASATTSGLLRRRRTGPRGGEGTRARGPGRAPVRGAEGREGGGRAARRGQPTSTRSPTSTTRRCRRGSTTRRASSACSSTSAATSRTTCTASGAWSRRTSGICGSTKSRFRCWSSPRGATPSGSHRTRTSSRASASPGRRSTGRS